MATVTQSTIPITTTKTSYPATFQVPTGARVLAVRELPSAVGIWWEIPNPAATAKTRSLVAVKNGAEVTTKMIYAGTTVHLGLLGLTSLVLHTYEVCP